MPVRLQRRRTKGYRLPPDAIYVGRPSRWGNSYITGPKSPAWRSVETFERTLRDHLAKGVLDPTYIDPLRGHDLACWCGLCPAHVDGLPVGVKCDDWRCEPCHADVLLELANR